MKSEGNIRVLRLYLSKFGGLPLFGLFRACRKVAPFQIEQLSLNHLLPPCGSPHTLNCARRIEPREPPVMTPSQNFSPSGETLRVLRWTNRCTVLGPGTRAVVWVQGCPFRCPGCVIPESLPFEGGVEHSVPELAAHIAPLQSIEGVTFSGGEPFAQPAAVAALIDSLRVARPELTFFSYTGYTLENLVLHGTSAQHSLLQRLDVLVDGPYIQSRHTDLRWRGSDNQRVFFLTPRYRDWAARLDDRGTWLEFEVDAEGVAWMGIPPRDFRPTFEQSLARQLHPLPVLRSEP